MVILYHQKGNAVILHGGMVHLQGIVYDPVCIGPGSPVI